MKYIVTDFYNEFVCIGGQCIDNCCKEWEIAIEEDTYRKYASLEEPLRSWICDHIGEEEQEGQEKCRKIVLNSDGRCPFLNRQNLCDIYSLVSPDAMSSVCQTYPRRIRQYYDVFMGTLMLSCPEAARMIIEKKEPIQFNFLEDQAEYIAENADWTLYNELINGLVIATGILQDRDLPLWQRFLLMFIEADIIQEHIERQDISTLRRKLECLREEEYRKRIFAGCQTNPPEVRKWRFIYSLFETVNLQIRNLSEEKKKTLEKFQYIAPDDEQTYQMCNRKFKKLELDIEYENIAVQCVYEYFIDALNGKSLYINMMKMYVLLILIRTIEVLDYHMKGELTVGDRAAVIAKVSKIMEHSGRLEDLAENIVYNNDKTKIHQMAYIFD